jgi:hypothetical protein
VKLFQALAGSELKVRINGQGFGMNDFVVGEKVERLMEGVNAR